MEGNKKEINTSVYWRKRRIEDSVFHRFRHAKFAFGGSILSTSQFLLLPKWPLKNDVHFKGGQNWLKKSSCFPDLNWWNIVNNIINHVEVTTVECCDQIVDSKTENLRLLLTLNLPEPSGNCKNKFQSSFSSTSDHHLSELQIHKSQFSWYC